MDDVLRRGWRNYFKYNWVFGLLLILLWGIPRFAIVLESYVTRSYFVTMFVFLSMWFVPLIFLTKAGRRYVGIRRPNNWGRVCLSFIGGAASCLILFFCFVLLFDKTVENPFVYIGGNNPGATIDGSERQIYFIIAAIPSMIFSPIGEELFYRGVVHGSFVGRFGERVASVFDSLAFALTHLAHFGIVYVSGVWQFLPVPSLMWVLSMFLVCQLFFQCKQFCDSIWGAVLAHSGFNLAMMYAIFYLL